MDIIEKKQKKLKIQSWRRGMKEMDLILGKFFDENSYLLDWDEINCYERLLQEDDQLIYGWILNKHDIPKEFTILIKKISDFTCSKSLPVF